MQGLNNPGQVINGPDLTEESQDSNLANLDTFGHGTFMAGIIAGHDPGVRPTATDQTSFMGVAPDARIVSVKVTDARGLTDVSQVIAGIDWVVQHRNDAGLNIRVINLSFGTDSTQSFKVDPLAFAAEVAWRAGIVVVVSAGNNGTAGSQLTMPALDPNLLAVGAADMNGQSSASAASVPSFSSRGNGIRNPDVLAPGAHVQSLRDPNSYIDTTYGSSGRIDDRFFRGSGTSEAAAYVSGSVAQLLQQRPNLTPDQVKALLVSSANKIPYTDSKAQGAGVIDIVDALAKAIPSTSQYFGFSTGTGSLDKSRGSNRLVLNGVTLSGERDIFGNAFDSAAMAYGEVTGHTWSGGVWNGSTWSGSTWSGGDWTGHTWSANDWSGHTWSCDDWATGTWTGSTWSGSTWSGSTWSGAVWSSDAWASSIWSGETWN